MDDKPQVVIIGAGLAGLTAALHLAERGLSVLILEADPDYAGGRLRGGPPVTFEHKGQRWSFPAEHGLHGVWNQYHNLKQFLAREKIDPGYVPARREAWVLRQPWGKVQWTEGGSALRTSLIPAPFHYLALFIRLRFLQMLTLRDLASLFRVLGGLLLAIAFDPAVEGIRLEGLTLADFFKGWSPTFQELFIGLARNFTSAPPAEVPQAGFIAFLRFYTVLRRDAWRFKYFERDSDTAVIAPFRKRLEAAGVCLRLGTRVTALSRDGDDWRVVWDGGSINDGCAKRDFAVLVQPRSRWISRSPRGGNFFGRFCTRQLFLATPLPATISRLAPGDGRQRYRMSYLRSAISACRAGCRLDCQRAKGFAAAVAGLT